MHKAASRFGSPLFFMRLTDPLICSTIVVQKEVLSLAKQAVYQIRMDEEIKTRVESLYRELGTSFAEAVRMFAVQSLREHGLPFTPSEARGKAFGILSSHANPALIEQEENMFKEAMVQKHANR